MHHAKLVVPTVTLHRLQPIHWLLLVALVPASLFTFTLSPEPPVLNQLLAIGGWGLVVAVAAGPMRQMIARAYGLVAALAIYAVAPLSPLLAGHVPLSLAASTCAEALAAVAVVLAGCSAGRAQASSALRLFFVALLIVGVGDVVIAIVQVFLPNWADGNVIARSGLAGRAVGNLRQPNHLSTLALWSAVAVVPLIEAPLVRSRRALQMLLALLFALFVFTVELSASRTGMVGVVMLALWGVVDTRLARSTRLLLIGALLIYAIGWIGMDHWAQHGHHTFGAEERLGQRDISSSRFGIWSETLAVLRSNMLAGVGANEFNFAWTLTPFPHRPPEFFDHCHNLELELLVELGLPLGVLIVSLLAAALWQAFRRAWRVGDAAGVGYRAALVVVLMVALHSQLEYPLWYAYFLLPTAWAWGCCLGADARGINIGPVLPQEGPRPAPGVVRQRAFFIVGGLLMLLGALWAFQQYLVVARIFDAGDDERPLEQRIAQGRQTLFYVQHADYAAATVSNRPANEWRDFRVATHYLLDTRLMMAWATAFAELGDVDRARYIAARLREFDKPEVAEFFAPCTHPQSGRPLPFQCAPPQHPHNWREFRDPRLYRLAPGPAVGGRSPGGTASETPHPDDQ